MPRRRNPVPKYRHHKPSGQAVVTVRNPDGSRRDVYLGGYDTPASHAEYRRVLESLAAGRDPGAAGSPPPPVAAVTVAEVLVAYLKQARDTYRNADGKPTPTYHALARSLRKLKELHAHTPAAEFRPKDLKAVRAALVADDLSRKVVNARVQVVKKVFRWAVAEDMLPPDVSLKLDAVEGLAAGRTEAPDHAPVTPADPAHVAAAVPHMPPAVAAVVQLQRMTAARCGELVALRPRDIDRTNPDAWEYAPAAHKGTWRGKSRVVYFGRRSQELLAPFLLKAGGPDAYVFSPARSEEERLAGRAADRKTPRYPSHMKRNAAKRKKSRTRKPGTRYTTQSVRQAIARACEKAGVPVWHPHQLRHLAGTEIRGQLGAEVARAVLGHTLAAMTEHYMLDLRALLASVGLFEG